MSRAYSQTPWENQCAQLLVTYQKMHVLGTYFFWESEMFQLTAWIIRVYRS